MERCAAVCVRRAFSVLQFFVTFSLRVGPLSGYAVCAPKRRKMRVGAGAPGEKSEKAEHLGDVRLVTYSDIMMPGSKGLSPHELAHRWVKDLLTRPDRSIKVG